jgi:beta-N-acetylhexosaminidase
VTSAAIYGCCRDHLTADEERAFFAEVRPWGFILFRRNVETPDQVRRLTADLRDSVGRGTRPVLIDQEGGRVQRLGPPHWAKYPPGEAYLKATNDPLTARELARLGGRLMAHDLKAVGINIDCAPVLDVPVPGRHDIIGDRAYATRSGAGRPAGAGDGRGPAGRRRPAGDQAHAGPRPRLRRQPQGAAGRSTPTSTRWTPGTSRRSRPCPTCRSAMTAHIVFTAIDKKRPATHLEEGDQADPRASGLRRPAAVDDL